MAQLTRASAAVSAAASLILAAAGPADAAEGRITLPGATAGAVTIDLDGDGARELVRLLDPPGPGYVVDRWTFDGGAWAEAGSIEVLARPLPDEVAEVAALLRVRLEERERLLVWLAGSEAGARRGVHCCLEVHELRIEAGGMRLHPIGVDLPTAPSYVEVLDIDADGTDELLARTMESGPTVPGQFEGTVELLRRGGPAAFESIHRLAADPGVGISFGPFDGVPGDDLVIGPDERGDLTRVACVDGTLASEEGHLDLGERFAGYVAGSIGERLIIAGGEGLRVAEWPRGRDAVVTARRDTLDFPSPTVIGRGATAVIVVLAGFDPAAGGPRATFYDRDLRPLLEVPPGEDLRILSELAATVSLDRSNSMLWAHVGPIPDAVAGAPAYVVGSTLAVAGPDGLRTQRIAPLLGMAPIGTLGPGDRWLALGDASVATGSVAFLEAAPSVPSEAGRVDIATVSEAIDRATDGPDVAIEFRGAVELDAEETRERRILGHGDGFEVIVTGPVGTTVIVAHSVRAESIEITDGPGVLAIEPSRTAADENQDFERVVGIFAPDGSSTLERWIGTFVREPPTVSATSATNLFQGSATIRGKASPETAIVVDGRSIERVLSGEFEVVVPAGLWPRAVEIKAVDPLGNEASTRVQVFGLIDYRGLPSAVLLGLATVAAGVAMYVRAPRRRASPPAGPDDAVLEELESDPD